MKPCALFISPVLPQPDGGGPGLRAWHIIQALASAYDIMLLVGNGLHPCDASVLEQASLPVVARLALPVGYFQRAVMCWHRIAANRFPLLLRSLLTTPYDCISLNGHQRTVLTEFVGTRHIYLIQSYYLSTLPVALAIETMVPTARLQLDLADIESETRLRLAQLHAIRGERRQATAWEMEAARCEELEREHLSRLARVTVCSETDRIKLQSRYGLENVGVVPNTVAVSPTTGLPPVSTRADFQLLFVGSLNYLPNLDAAQWLSREIIPAIRARTQRPFKVIIVGRDVTGVTQQLVRDNPDIELPGFVPDLDEYYNRSSLVIVPLRAGGGTRIKIIEAFGLARPVVATTIAVEGLEVKDGVHALIAEDAAGLADHCVHLLENPHAAAALVKNALGLYQRCYHPEVMAASVLDNCLDTLTGKTVQTRQNHPDTGQVTVTFARNGRWR